MVLTRTEDTTTEDDQTNSPAENILAGDEEVVGGSAGGNAIGVGSGGDQMPPTQKKRGRPVVCPARCEGCLTPNCGECRYCLNASLK